MSQTQLRERDKTTDSRLPKCASSPKDFKGKARVVSAPAVPLSLALSLMALGFCVGVLSLGRLPELSLLEGGLLLLIIAAAGLVLRSRTSLIGCLLFAGFLLGACRIEMGIDQNLSSRLWLPQTADLIAMSTGLPEQTPSGYRQQYTLMGYHPESPKLHGVTSKSQVLVYLGSSSEAMAHQPLGQWYRLRLKLNPIRSSASQAFSQEKWLLPQNVAATGYLLEAKPIADPGAKVQSFDAADSLIQLTSLEDGAALAGYRVGDQVFMSEAMPVLGWFDRLNLRVNQHRMNLRKHLMGLQAKHAEASGLSLSLLTGDRGVLDPKITELYQHFGISHLLAISGPHVLFAAMVFSMMLKLMLNLVPASYRLMDRGSWIAPGAIIVAGAYAWLSGLDVPALRTLIMFALVGAGLRVRSLGPTQVIVLCAAIILAVRPLSVFEVGFWLSLAGVSALMLISRMQLGSVHVRDQTLSGMTKLRALFTQAVIAQALIFALLLPITLGFFGVFSYLAIPANLIAMAVIGLVVVPLNLLGYLFLALSPAVADFIFTVNIKLIDGFDRLLFMVQSLTPGALIRADWTGIELLIAALALVCLMVLSGKSKLIGLMLLLLVVAPKKAEPDQLIVFDGLNFSATALISAHQTPWLLVSDLPRFDSRSEKNLAFSATVLGEQLLQRSDHWRLIFSEGEDTASWQQLIALMPQIHIERVISNHSMGAPSDGVLSSNCESGTQVDFGAGRLEILAPWPDLQTEEAGGCVVAWRKGDKTMALVLPEQASTSVQVLKKMCLLPDPKVTVFPASTLKEVIVDLQEAQPSKGWLIHALSFTGISPDWSWQPALAVSQPAQPRKNPKLDNALTTHPSGHLLKVSMKNDHLINLRDAGQINAVFEADHVDLHAFRAGKPWLRFTQLPSNTP